MLRKLGLGLVAATAPVLLVLSLVGGAAAQWLFALLAAAFPVFLIALAAPPRGCPPAFAGTLLALLLLLETGVVGMLVLTGAESFAWLGGLPLPMALQLYVVFLAPLALVALAYGLLFDRFGIPEESLERLRREHGARREGEDRAEDCAEDCAEDRAGEEAQA